METPQDPDKGALFITQTVDAQDRLEGQLEEAEEKAWRSLARYKFIQFGYWAAIWVHLNKLSVKQHPNPFARLVKLARKEVKLG